MLTFDPDGREIAVETEVAEGLAATRLRAAGDAAAWMDANPLTDVHVPQYYLP